MMKDKNDRWGPIIDADKYAYDMAGLSPCESCEKNTHSNLCLKLLCQNKCEKYKNWWGVCCKYFYEYFGEMDDLTREIMYQFDKIDTDIDNV